MQPQEIANQAQVVHELSAQTREWSAAALVVFMFVVTLGVLFLIGLYSKVGEEKTKRVRFRRRAIQFYAVGLIVPAVLILALDGLLAGEALATIIGAFIGYVLSGVGDD